jgi:transcriptional regulator with XRE-family HTH domain
VATQLLTLRQDCGLSQRSVAAVAGIAGSTLGDIEAGRAVPSLEVLARVAAALGATLDLRLHPGTGPLVRDHLQSAMLEALLRRLDRRWRRRLEVAVYRPVRGVIDAVLEDPSEPVLVATEAQSELRRIEQQVRWSQAKADALAASHATTQVRPGPAADPGGGPAAPVSRLLLLRSTRATRAVAHEYADLLAVSYPARHADLVAALTGSAPWPGSGIVWCVVEGGRGRLLDRPPRGITLGR